jgi:S1-C subfamily serine protease
MLKKILFSFFVFLLLLIPVNIFAHENHGEELIAKVEGACEYSTQIINEIKYSPIREIFGCHDYEVNWDHNQKKVVISNKERLLELKIGEKLVLNKGCIDESYSSLLIIRSMVYIPVSFVEEYVRNHPFTLEKESMDKILESVVMVETYDGDDNKLETGSGFFISSDGTLVTSFHLIEFAETMKVILNDNTTHKAKLISGNKEVDLALLRVKDLREFKPVILANEPKLFSGQNIFVVSSPFGLINSVSTGVVSHPNRKFGNGTMLQITAPVYYGSSGGAVFNQEGEVIGIVSGGSTNAPGINLAIPVVGIKNIKS